MAGKYVIDRDLVFDVLWMESLLVGRLYQYLLGKASYVTGVKIGQYTLGLGQWIRSYQKLRGDLEYPENGTIKTPSKSIIKAAVDRLRELGLIETEETSLGTLFTIVEYEASQDFKVDYYSLIRGRFEQITNKNRTPFERLTNNKNKDITKTNKDKPFFEKEGFLSEDWRPSEEIIQWAKKERPDLDIEEKIESFKDYNLANPKTAQEVMDWDKRFKVWIRNALKGKAQSGPSAPSQGTKAGRDVMEAYRRGERLKLACDGKEYSPNELQPVMQKPNEPGANSSDGLRIIETGNVIGFSLWRFLESE